jgi:hypothetical protein
MFSLLALLFLGIAFLILVTTFVWVARLLAQRAQRKGASAPGEEPQDQEVEEPEMARPEGRVVRGRGYGANYGVLLGILSCGLFFAIDAPLLLALAFAGLFYSGRALTNGVRHFRVIIWRALFGLLLNAGAVALHFSQAIGAFNPVRFF